MASRPAQGYWEITNHAVVRYRERAIACPERNRNDFTLRCAMIRELDFFASLHVKGGIRHVRCGPRWRVSRKSGKNVCDQPTYAFVVLDGVLTTVLGFMMQPTEAKLRDYARLAHERLHSRYLEAVRRRDTRRYA